MATKKVLFTSHTANFSKFNRPFMRWFKEQGYQVHYASAGEEEVLDCDKHFTIPFQRSPYRLDNVKAYKRLKKIIEKENYALIHTHTPVGGVVTRLAARKARKRGTKVVYTAHGFHFYTGAPIKNWLLYFVAEKLVAPLTDTLITINAEDYMRAKKRLRAKRIEKMNGVGVDLSRFRPPTQQERANVRKELGIPRNVPVIIYVAEFIFRKRHSFIVNALPELVLRYPDLRVIFAGIGQELEATKRLVKKLKLQDNVIFLGYRKDVDRLFRASDISISASFQEGLPINAIESMASGLPVVCARIRGNVDIITEKRNGLLYDVTDYIGFIDAIDTLLRDEKERVKISTNNRIDVEKYSLEQAISNMSNIYGEV